MYEIADASQSVITRLEEKFGRFYQSAKITLSSAHYAQDLSFASLVKVDHVIYKQRAYALINNPDDSELRKAVSVDHQNCRMGKWYEGAGKEVFGGLTTYRSLLEPHSQVHNAVHKAVALLDNSWEQDEKIQAQIIAAMQVAETGSTAVMEALNKMVADKHPDMVKLH